jgi:hypothetical protein
MKTLIEIECDDKRELLLHLTVIREDIEKLNLDEPFNEPFKIEDNNCYGTHDVTIADESWPEYARRKFNESLEG